MSAAKSNTATETTATAEPDGRYVGRFAPSPTGELHRGSLLTAVASYLEARRHRGRWLLRIEDLDRAREVRGAADKIQRRLESMGMAWDGPVLYQSTRLADYTGAIKTLRSLGLLFECRCSRKQLGSTVYPGTCRSLRLTSSAATATRVNLPDAMITFQDGIQGQITGNLARHTGDLIVRRRDDVIAYALAVVVDDAHQGVTHVVRGADLLEHTAPQIFLQTALRLPRVAYAHVPILVAADGSKLAKSRHSATAEATTPAEQLTQTLQLLGLRPPAELPNSRIADIWVWALQQWQLAKVTKVRELRISSYNPRHGQTMP